DLPGESTVRRHKDLPASYRRTTTAPTPSANTTSFQPAACGSVANHATDHVTTKVRRSRNTRIRTVAPGPNLGLRDRHRLGAGHAGPDRVAAPDVVPSADRALVAAVHAAAHDPTLQNYALSVANDPLSRARRNRSRKRATAAHRSFA